MKLRDKRGHVLNLLVAFVLVGLVATAAEAQKGRLFNGAERARVIEETARLAAIQERHEAKILALEGVHGIGIGLDKEKRQLAFLVVIEPQIEMPDLPRQIEDVPVMVRHQNRSAPLHGPSTCTQPCHADQQLSGPVEMGNSAFTEGICGTCTLGFVACELFARERVYVTNAHCSTDSSGCEGTAVPGTETTHVALEDVGATCPPAGLFLTPLTVGRTLRHFTPICSLPNTPADLALIESNAGETRISIRDIGSPSAFPGLAVVGDTVQKSGRTTGLTQGTVNAVNFSLIVGPYCCGNATFQDQIQINAAPAPFALAGDSGAAVLNLDNEIVGLLFSGDNVAGTTGTAHPIDDVLNLLSLSLNHLDCSDLCAAETAASETDDPQSALSVVRRFRDGFLRSSAGGKEYVALYEKHSPAVVGIMTRRPELLARTAALLSRHLRTLSALTEKGQATMSKAELEEVVRLLGRHEKAAEKSPDLRRALRRIAADLKNPKFLREFGIQVR